MTHIMLYVLKEEKTFVRNVTKSTFKICAFHFVQISLPKPMNRS